MAADVDAGTGADLVGLGADVPWPDRDAATAAARTDDRLGDLAGWLASIQGHEPTDFSRGRLVVIGDTAPQVELAELAGLGVRGHGTERDGGLDSGVRLVDDEVEAGADLLVIAVPGADVAALALVSVLTNTEPVKVLTRGTALSPDDWMDQAVAVRDARRRCIAHRGDPDGLLDAVQSPGLSCAAGAVLRAAARRTPVVLDGLGAVAAGLLAQSVAARAPHWCQVADRVHHPAVDLATLKLGFSPLLDLGITAADGTAGALATLLLRAAVRSGTRHS